ncbi:MAG: Calx-beta domain-containing protein, partial [Gaiellales bacterium]
MSLSTLTAVIAVATTVGALLGGTADVAHAACPAFDLAVPAPVVPGLSVSVADASLIEADSGTSGLSFTVRLSQAASQLVTVDYATADGTATAPSDYTATSGTVVFTIGQTIQTLTVPVVGDTIDERTQSLLRPKNETFSIMLSNPVNAAMGDREGVGTITDNDTAGPTLSIANAIAFEYQQATFELKLSPSTNQPVSVDYTTADGTASAGADYLSATGTVQFASGQTTQRVTVTLVNDTDDEGDENFFLRLSAAVNATIGDDEGASTIYNDDEPGLRTGIADSWQPMATGLLPPRLYNSTIWSGDELVVWGGSPTGHWDEASMMSDGAAYDPATDSWRCLPAPPITGRRLHAAVWAGTEMIIWGGDRGARGFTADGAAYNPLADTWRRLANAPLSPRRLPNALWTGTEMILWGGLTDHFQPAADGASYNPLTDSWRMLPTAPLGARYAHAAVWTGTEMLLWGGNRGVGVAHADGAAYNPTTNSWRTLSEAPISARYSGTGSGAWTGTEMIVWGGYDSSGEDADPLADGAAYNPLTDTWRKLSPSPLPPGLASGIVWADPNILVWTADANGIPKGASYNPVTDTWVELPPPPISEGFGALPVWTGDQVLMWGTSEVEHNGDTVLAPAALGFLPTEPYFTWNPGTPDPIFVISPGFGSENQDQLTFSVGLTHVPDQPVSVDYATVDGTAIAGADYTAVTGTLDFAAGQTTKAINVPILPDNEPEATEHFFLKLIDPDNGIIVSDQAQGIIIDDDVPTIPPILSILPTMGEERDPGGLATQLTFPVQLWNPSNQTV